MKLSGYKGHGGPYSIPFRTRNREEGVANAQISYAAPESLHKVEVEHTVNRHVRSF